VKDDIEKPSTPFKYHPKSDHHGKKKIIADILFDDGLYFLIQRLGWISKLRRLDRRL
jgi:hypothetical protein